MISISRVRNSLIKGLFVLFLLTMIQAPASAQFYNEDDNAKNKLGLRVGIGASSMFGTALQNPGVTRGFTAAFYLRNRLGKSLHLQSEGGVSYRGSNFSNGEDAYEKILLLYADVPVMLMIDIGKNQQNNIIVGSQLSVLIRSSIYVDNDPVPKQYGLPLKDLDWLAVAGFHHSWENVGVMITGKYSLINVNDHFDMPGIKPAQNPAGTIRNFAVELSVLF